MKELKALKAVYSYFFPEVRDIVNGRDRLPTWLFLTTTPNEHYLHGFNPPLFVPGLPGGTVDLDRIHEPVIERIIKAYKPLVPALGEFEYRYPTAGSSEGIFHILAALKAGNLLTETSCEPPISVLEGEYEGYGEYAKALGMGTDFTEFTPKEALTCSPTVNGVPRVWFISNPSARNGAIIDNEFIKKLCDRGSKVVLDLAYAGMTKPYKFDVNHNNIIAVVMSLSKPYGVFRFRIGGFAFTREPIISLFANKWFKDVPALLKAVELVERIPPGSLYKRYSDLQRLIIDAIRRDTGLPIRASNVFLLAWMKGCSEQMLTPKQKKMVAEFKRGDLYRFCLTPYFEEIERRGMI
jgi:hypothetical protein